MKEQMNHHSNLPKIFTGDIKIILSAVLIGIWTVQWKPLEETTGKFIFWEFGVIALYRQQDWFLH